ncbi:MAG: ytrE 2 [Haloplasmataceae bacterium]|jgi:ABC-type lipoprotein export system ATPase subunit|nr:ytrE 2 [Haloplasmataceae bacterium]
MIEIKGLNKIYYTKDLEFGALRNINLKIKDGEFVAVLGESGSGKSTLLNMISGIDEYTEGEIIIDGVNTKRFNDTKWREFRNKNIGFIFQRYNLIEHLTAYDNIVLPLLFGGEKKSVYDKLAKEMLQKIGLINHINTPASKLSGGEKQRIAIARSILMNPHILLCDEPTGALDSASAEIIMKMIRQFAENRIVILVTHDEKIANDYADRIIRIHDGQIIDNIYVNKAPDEDDLDEIKVRKKHGVSNYKKVNGGFVKFIANANFKQNIGINFKIVLSFVIGLTILFVINLILRNLIIHNQLMFERNNDYQKYSVVEYQNDTIEKLKANDLISEVGMENSYLVEYSYLKYNDSKLQSQFIESANKVHNPVLKTLPQNFDNFYLKDYLLEVNDQHDDILNGVFVTNEFIYNHYLNISLIKNKEIKIKDTLKQYPLESFIDKTIMICGYNDPHSNLPCYETQIVGIIDSNYNGVNYSDQIYMSQAGFTDYLEYLKTKLSITNIDRLYQSKMYFYLKDFQNSTFDSNELEDSLLINIENDKIKTYEQVQSLEVIGNYIIFAIIITLFIIFSTVVINIISFNISARTKDIGVYTAIGVSRISIRRIFIKETIKVVEILIIILSFIYVLLSIIFSSIYGSIIAYNSNLYRELGRINNINYQIDAFVIIVIFTTILYLMSVYIPAYKVSMKKAIDTLTW